MKGIAVALAAALAIAAPARAAVVTYEYIGPDDVECVGEQGWCDYWTMSGALDGFMTIDETAMEEIYGFSLVNVIDGIIYGASPDWPEWWQIGFAGGWLQYDTTFQFTTDANRNFTAWSLTAYSGPPDFYFSSSTTCGSRGYGCGTPDYNEFYFWGSGGSLDLYAIEGVPVAPIPLPAAGWLLIAGLGGLLMLRQTTIASP